MTRYQQRLEHKTGRQGRSVSSDAAIRCCRKFVHFFPNGFQDEKYFEWERGYKWKAHEQWNEVLGRAAFKALLKAEKFDEIAAHAVRIESRTNLLFSFEKMALRDAIKAPEGARAFATGLYQFLHGAGGMERNFQQWCDVIESLPRRQTRVLTHPVVTIFGFIAQPEKHIFLKPNVTRKAAKKYGFDFHYHSRPSWQTYASLLLFAEVVKNDLNGRKRTMLHPRDMMDVQSFLWVQGSDEYEE